MDRLKSCEECGGTFYDIVENKNGFAIACRYRAIGFSCNRTCSNITAFYPTIKEAKKAWNRTEKEVKNGQTK